MFCKLWPDSCVACNFRSPRSFSISELTFFSHLLCATSVTDLKQTFRKWLCSLRWRTNKLGNLKKTLICPDVRECFIYFELSSSASFIARCSAGSGCPVVVLALPLPSFYLGGSYSPGNIVHTAGLTQEQTHGLLLITELNPLAETQLFFVKTAQLLLSYKLLTWKSLLSPRPSYMTERARLLTAPFQFCLYRSQRPEVKLYYTHTFSQSVVLFGQTFRHL